MSAESYMQNCNLFLTRFNRCYEYRNVAIDLVLISDLEIYKVSKSSRYYRYVIASEDS